MSKYLSNELLVQSIRTQMERGNPTISAVAHVLDMSTRTLQRRLAGSGQSFSGLLDTVRHEFACDLLAQQSTRLYDIAAILAYADPGSFTRAFHRWSGMTPRDYRRRTRLNATA